MAVWAVGHSSAARAASSGALRSALLRRGRPSARVGRHMVDIATRLGPLEARVVQADASVRPELAVVLCHGYGASGSDLVPLAPDLLARAPGLGSRVRFVFPAAPLSLAEFAGGEARAWWPVDWEANLALRAGGAEGRAELRARVPDGLAHARRQLAGCVEVLMQTSGLSSQQVVLGGFSQGAMVTTDLALRQDEAPAALVILSGTLTAEAEWRSRAGRRQGLRVLQSHGRQDPILPFAGAEALRDLLQEAGLKVDFLPFDGPHTIPEEALNRLGALLLSLLDDAP
ncbi:MAG: alpha/beta hydrolase [Myxococcaceae bacterium]